MKQSLAKILSDDEQLDKYIRSLEEELAKTESVDDQVELILNNILNLYSNFTDRRALRASNISAVTEMLKLKSELPMRRIQTKKMILDILSKKRELEIREKGIDANSALAGTASDLLRAIYARLDQRNIHPEIDADILEYECNDIIDSPKSLNDVSKDPESESDLVIDVVKLQQDLDESNLDESCEDSEDCGDGNIA